MNKRTATTGQSNNCRLHQQSVFDSLHTDKNPAWQGSLLTDMVPGER